MRFFSSLIVETPIKPSFTKGEILKCGHELFLLSFFFFLFSFFFFSNTTNAQVNVGQQINDQIKVGASSAGYGEAKDPRQVAAEIVQIGLGLAGTAFIILVVMSGYWYLTARGDESKVEKATTTVRGAVIGIVLVLIAWSITIFVSSRIQQSLKAPERSERLRGVLGR